jgi:hypothetical protein
VLNDTLENTVGGRRCRSVLSLASGVAVAKDVGISALHPVRVERGVKRHLDIGAVEVDLSTRWRIVPSVDYAKLAVRVGTCLCNVVDVEAWVDLEDGRVEVVKLITGAGLGAVRIGENRERTLRRRELEVCVHVGRVVASILTLTGGVQERLVEIQEVLPVLDIGQDDDLLLNCLVTDDRVIDRDTCQVEVFVVIRGDEAVRNVRDIVTTVTAMVIAMRLLSPLACNVCLPVLGLERIDETLVEAAELSSQLHLVSDVGSALAITDADRLFDPEHVGQIGPGVRILDRSQCTGLPSERAVLG